MVATASLRVRTVSFLVTVALGFAFGILVGHAAYQAARAQTGCPIERGSFTNGPDSISDDTDGVDEDNRWEMLAGRDFGRSLACNDGTNTDRFHGNDDNDDLGGGSGNDVIDGDANNDQIFGGASSVFGGDGLIGDIGADTITDAEPNDFETVTAGSGQDTINVQDGDPNDTVNAGAGSDTCIADSGDSLNSC